MIGGVKSEGLEETRLYRCNTLIFVLFDFLTTFGSSDFTRYIASSINTQQFHFLIIRHISPGNLSDHFVDCTSGFLFIGSESTAIFHFGNLGDGHQTSKIITTNCIQQRV